MYLVSGKRLICKSNVTELMTKYHFSSLFCTVWEPIAPKFKVKLIFDFFMLVSSGQPKQSCHSWINYLCHIRFTVSITCHIKEFHLYLPFNTTAIVEFEAKFWALKALPWPMLKIPSAVLNR